MAKIIGNTTTTPVMPSDWAQTDETKVDYIKNKPTKLSQFENDIGAGGGSVDLSDYVKKEDLATANVEFAECANSAVMADCDNAGNMITLYYATKEEVGDIEAALDSILAIQGTIVGGGN